MKNQEPKSLEVALYDRTSHLIFVSFRWQATGSASSVWWEDRSFIHDALEECSKHPDKPTIGTNPIPSQLARPSCRSTCESLVGLMNSAMRPVVEVTEPRDRISPMLIPDQEKCHERHVLRLLAPP
jgi:hypothetical protein